jgi:outer membrane protein TolC
LISSRNQRVDAQIDYQLAAAALQKAMGVLASTEVQSPRVLYAPRQE